MSSDVQTVDVYLKHGNVTMKMTVRMDLTKLDVFIHRAQTVNLLVRISVVYLCHK